VTERWLPVVGRQGSYEVSDHGRVRSVDRVIQRKDGTTYYVEGCVLKPTLKAGYPAVCLCPGERKGQLFKIHTLVLEAFRGPCPAGQQCCHGNDISTDNRLENLRWDTPRANMFDRVRNGRHNNASKTHCNHGHPFDTIPQAGGRDCLECRRRRGREYHARKRANHTRRSA
jgi:NUMOD4 motif/HNH endonuclease